MFPHTVTLYHRRTDGERDRWTPAVISGVHQVRIRREETAQAAAASVSGTVNLRYMLVVPASDWPEDAAPGDYVLEGSSGLAAYTGSAGALRQAGGRQIEQITAFRFGSSLDHYEVILR